MSKVVSVAFTHYASDARVRRMCEALSDRGDDVVAITLRDDGERKLRQLAGVTVRSVALRQHRGSSIVRYIAQYLAFTAIVAWLLIVERIKGRIDVVHVNNMPNFIVFATLPIRLFGVRVVLDLHDPMPELFEVKFAAGPRHPIVRMIGAVEVASIAYADRAIAVHSVQQETFSTRGSSPDRFTIVQNVADPRYFPVGAALDQDKDDATVRLVYHGTMAPRLGLDLLIEALAKARVEQPHLELLLIGDGDDTARLQSLIEDHNLGDAVTFDPGFVPVEDLLPHLIHADIGVVPANVNAFTRNMLPVKLLEYVTLGIPSISTDLPTVRRYFEPDEVTLVAPGDVDAMAGAIARLAGDPELRRQQALAALRFVDRHSWSGERDRYLGLIDDLTSDSPRHSAAR